MAMKLFSRKKPKPVPATTGDRPAPARRARLSTRRAPVPRGRTPDFVPANRQPLDDDPHRRMHQQGRYNMILRQAAQQQGDPVYDVVAQQAKSALEQRLALVPLGNVSYSVTLSPMPGSDEIDVVVSPFLLDIHPVTKAEFQWFVDDDGYDNLDYWPEDIWPHLIEFKDATGKPGPRYWQNGRHNARLADHPVTGVSWYEANAYAAWMGQRLPTEAEWQMAASWRIQSAADLLRRFPWGDAMDNSRCNVWSSKIGTTVPVTEYPQGAAPNHVLQLVGNVWEWLHSGFEILDDHGRQIVAEMPMYAVRGGAFDTYFESQLTSQFRTGQLSLARIQNLGFRCAMDLSEATWLDED